MEECKYILTIPIVPDYPAYKEERELCGAYYESKPTKENKWKHWANYPECREKNCPLKHPELLNGRTLETEESK